MTHTVFHTGYGIELNLSERHLGHPDRPGLLHELTSEYERERLICVGDQENDQPPCPGPMTIRLRNGKPHAMHVNPGQRGLREGESRFHEALKEHIAAVARAQGAHAKVEQQPYHNKRRTDCVVTGPNGIRVGWEVQISGIGAPNADARTAIARQDGLTPLWLVVHPDATPIDRAPWARITARPEQDMGRLAAVPVVDGVSRLRRRRCDERNPLRCTEQGKRSGHRCGGWHAQWEPAYGMQLDELITQTTLGRLVPLRLGASPTRRGQHLWVSPEQLDEFRASLIPAPVSVPPRRARSTAAPLRALPRDERCSFGKNSGIRAESRRHAANSAIIRLAETTPHAIAMTSVRPPPKPLRWEQLQLSLVA